MHPAPHVLDRVRAYRRHHGGDPGEEFLVLTHPLPPRTVPPGVDIVIVDEHADVALIRENLEVNERAFDPAAPPVGTAQAEAFRSELGDARAITVRASGTPVCAGMVLPVHRGVAELAGIGTLVPERRRGYATVATVALTGIAFQLGADLVVLSTDNPGARRLYQRLGFAPAA